MVVTIGKESRVINGKEDEIYGDRRFEFGS